MSDALGDSAGEPPETAFVRPHRLYLGAVAILALWVGIWCYIVPAESARGIPWSLPPLCATFLGSMYFSGVAFTAGSMLPRRWANARVVLPMIAIWTGGLTIVSLFYLPAFNFSRPQVWVWFGAYIVYPLIALRLMWVLRHQRHSHPVGPSIPGWAKLYLAVQGVVMVGLAVVLLAAADSIQPFWPWRTGEMMLQMYSMPLFSYGLGSFILLRQRAWSEIRIGLVAMGLFTGFELAASLRFAGLLNGPAAAVLVWLAWLGITTTVLFSLAWLAFRPIWVPTHDQIGRLQMQPSGETR